MMAWAERYPSLCRTLGVARDGTGWSIHVGAWTLFVVWDLDTFRRSRLAALEAENAALRAQLETL